MAGNNVPGLLENSSPQFSQNVPGVNLPRRQEFTAEGEAIGDLGHNIQQAAHTGAEIYDRIQEQHDLSSSTKASVDMSVAHDQMAQSLKQSSPDGFIHDDGGEVVKNADGSQRTIAQEYWDQANQDYQSRQNSLSPRGAAMFRQQALPTMGRNTKMLQNEQLVMQQKDGEVTASYMKDTAARAFNDSFLPTNAGYYAAPGDSGGYYSSQSDDGSVKQYPSAQKLYDSIQDLQLYRQQQGSKGAYNPSEVEQLKRNDSSYLANQWLMSAKYDLMESAGSRAALHNSMKDASSTSSMQIHNLIDIVDGRDPESKRKSANGLPTVNGSLSPEQIDKWKKDLLGMIPAAKEVDKSEYELQKSQLLDSAKSSQTLDQFWNSPLFTKTVQMGSGLGITDSERVKDIAPAVSSAILSSAMASTSGINSPEAKRQAAAKILQDAELRWPQQAAMMGEKHTEGFGQAIVAEASKQVAAKLQEDEHQMREDPMKYMSGIQEGPQSGVQANYRSKSAHAVESKLDPSVDPSLFAIFKPMGGGKSILETAQATANNGYARMFGSNADVSVLQKTQFEDQAKRIKQTTDPRLVTSYFNQLDKQNITPAEKEAYIQNLVKKGGLPETYVDALNLKTPAEREARWADLKAGPPPMPEGMTAKQNEEDSRDENKNLFSFLDIKYGPNSPEARTARNNYDKSWQSDRLQAMNRGMSDSDSKAFANAQRDKTTGSIGIVGAQHDFFGTGWAHFGTVGPQVPVEFGSNKYTPEQQQNIRDTLLSRQSKEALSQYRFVQAPGSLPRNENAPSDAENIANNARMWRRIPGGWRLQAQQVDKENRGTGVSQDVQVYGKDTQPHYYDVREDEALAGPPKGSAPSVGPAKPHVKPAPMEPKL